MKQPKHTPGPWTISQRAKFTSINPRVCNMRKSNQANARLIAAAPEMLEALEWLLENINKNTLGTVKLEHGTGTVIDAHLYKLKIKAAIAKARGEK